MIKNSKLFAIMVILMSMLSLAGCGEKGLVIKNGPAGPDTGDLIDPLPEGLVADKENARHGDSDLKPNIN